MASLQKSAAVIITRPPEIIACFKVTDATSEENVYAIFDSHPRPSHPEGAGLIFSFPLENAAKVLESILHVDTDLISSPDLQWEAQLLTNCSGHIYVAKNGPLDAEMFVLESSLAILILRSEVKGLKQQTDAFTSQNVKLEEEVGSLENAVNQEKMKAESAAVAPSRREYQPARRNYYQHGHYQPNAVAGPSQLPLHTHTLQHSGVHSILADYPALVPAKSYRSNAITGPSRLPHPNRVPQYEGARSIFADNPPPVPTKMPSMYKFEDDILEQMQIDFIKEDSKVFMHNLNAASKLQKAFDTEDALLRNQEMQLRSYLQTTFNCGICLETCPKDDAATVDGCGHMVCRSCMRGFIISKIAEHRFPILCPICAAGDYPAPGAHHLSK